VPRSSDVIKRVAIGVALSFAAAVVAFFVTFNVYWRTVYPRLEDTDAHLDIPAAGAVAFALVLLLGTLMSVWWTWRSTRRRTAGT
jgi:hypothetical protein